MVGVKTPPVLAQCHTARYAFVRRLDPVATAGEHSLLRAQDAVPLRSPGRDLGGRVDAVLLLASLSGLGLWRKG